MLKFPLHRAGGPRWAASAFGATAGHAGRVPDAFSALVELAEALAAPVFELWMVRQIRDVFLE